MVLYSWMKNEKWFFLSKRIARSYFWLSYYYRIVILVIHTHTSTHQVLSYIIVTQVYFILGHIQCNYINLSYYRKNLQDPSTWLFHIIFNHFCFVGFTAPLSMYSSSHITISQWFLSLLYLLFNVAHLFSVVTSFLLLCDSLPVCFFWWYPPTPPSSVLEWLWFPWMDEWCRVIAFRLI